jgi:hypothetical protein
MPVIPKGLNSWKEISTIVAFASFAAETKASRTDSRLFRIVGLQSLNSTKRWVPKAYNSLPSFNETLGGDHSLLNKKIKQIGGFVKGNFL